MPGRHSERLRNNLFDSGLCTPGRDWQALLRRAIGEPGKAVVELLPVWLRPFDKAVKLVRGTSGWEHIDAARAAGKGVMYFKPSGARRLLAENLWVAEIQSGRERIDWQGFPSKVRRSCWPFFGSF